MTGSPGTWTFLGWASSSRPHEANKRPSTTVAAANPTEQWSGAITPLPCSHQRI